MNHNREPIGNTCSNIDKYQRWIKSEIHNDRDLDRMNEDELRESAKAMSSELNNCIDYLEEMRSANSKLREWGVEEAKKVDELENQIYELTNL